MKLKLLRLLNVIGFLLSLTSVFWGIAFLGGIVGFIYRLGCGDKLDSELIMILVVGIVCGLLCKGCWKFGVWAGEQFRNYKRKIDLEEDDRKKREAEESWKVCLEKWQAEEKARYEAMTPEERREYDEEQERKREAERLSQALQSVFSSSTVSTPLTSYDHDELDAVARSMEITRTYGMDWTGYDPEAPGPNPDTYSPPGYDPEASAGDIW